MLLDVSWPSESQVTSTLWNRSTGPDVYARWPLASASTGEYFFVGDEGSKRTLYALSPGGGPRGRLSPLEVGGPKLSGLSCSPDGRFLLFTADWIGGETSSRLPGSTRNDPTSEVNRLAELLKRNPQRHSAAEGITMQLYIRDLFDGRTTLIADEPMPGLIRTSSPNWSHDGRRILFHASPAHNDWQRSEMIVLEAMDGKPNFRSLGRGNRPAYSADDTQIAFLTSGDGVWLMNADGTERRRVANGFAAPFWSPDGDTLMLNNFSEPTECRLLDLATAKQELVEVPGHDIISWPRWVSSSTIVAVISTGLSDEAIVELDVTTPSKSKILRVHWNRRGIDLLPRWPLQRAATGQFFFVGVEGANLRKLYELQPGQNGKAVPMRDEARPDQLEGLVFSPDGRYLLFNANRPDRR